MNQEVIKAMNKKDKSNSWWNKVRRWWEKNSYKVMRVIFFPIWLILLAIEKFQEWADSRVVWSDARADEILNYYIPRYSKWYPEDKEFYFFDNGSGWSMSMAKRYLKRKDYRFWQKYTREIRQYLVNNFELEGFTKRVLDSSSSWTEISFIMK